VRRGWLDGIVQFDVRQLPAADDGLLRFGRQAIPSIKIVQIFLHDDVAASREWGVFLADQHGVDRFVAFRVFRSIDKTDQVSVVKITKSVHLICGCDRVPDACHDVTREFKTQIHALCAYVEEQVTRCAERKTRAGMNLTKQCSSAGRGGPKRRSHASDPKPMTQESPPPMSRDPTARMRIHCLGASGAPHQVTLVSVRVTLVERDAVSDVFNSIVVEIDLEFVHPLRMVSRHGNRTEDRMADVDYESGACFTPEDIKVRYIQPDVLAGNW